MSKLLEQIKNVEKKAYSIKDFGRVVTGKTPSKDNPEDWGEKIDFITPTDIKTDSKFYSGSNRKLSDTGIDRFKKMIIPAGSVLVTCIGTVGKVVMNREKALSNQQINSIVVENKDFDEDYVFYKVLSLVPVIQSSAIGSTMPIINKSSFEEIEFKAPDLAAQKKIASILSAYDEKIENNNKIIKNLEQMAQTIFNEWFVNFKFPGYEKVKKVDSEMGEIPEGWEVKDLGSLIDVSGGFSYKGEYLSSIKSETLLVTMGNISPNNRFNFDSIRYYNGEFPSKFLLRPGDIALATRDVTQDRAILGAPLVIPEILRDKKILLATNMYAVRNLSDIDNLFFFHLFKSDSYRERMITSAKGSNILMLTKDTILGFRLILPARTYVDKYLKIARNIKITIESCVEENIFLKSQRDQLLAKLI